MRSDRPEAMVIALGTLSAALLLGALGFQYLGRLPPCEMCLWQRWPHLAAAVLGLVGGWAVSRRVEGHQLAAPLVFVTAMLVGLSGVIGAYHAGVEWHWWAGPSQCTGSGFKYTGKLDLNEPVVMCDRAAWRLFGISMAGYNAIISLGAAAFALLFLLRNRRRA
ncbi:MAG: disulfide bond formation protein B [Alphaproteobacteria bacterium]|nr:disulfide bond formation protein B [Alphaproteobacteria bacterium]